MRFLSRLRIILLVAGVSCAALISAVWLPAQETTKDNPARGMPPRSAPSEYQVQAKAGMVTIAAEFMGHAVPTPEQTVSAEEYVVVDTGLYGPPGTRMVLARGDFSLRINGKKNASPSEPYELVFKSLKDPEWQPPEQEETKSSKSSISTGGGGGGEKTPPTPPKMPFELRRTMEQHVQRAAMQEGDRPLPQAGLLFFSYRGKAESIRSLELIYSGAAGSVTLDLRP
jgi:hypothetical protein